MTRRPDPRGLSAAIALAFTATPSLVAAQSSPQAEQLFRDGRRLMGERKYIEACAAFDASQRVEPTVATAMNLADCSERAGRLATAWGWFLDVAAKTRSSASAAALHDTAVRRAAAIEPRLSRLAIHVPDDARIEGQVITLDHTVLPSGAWSRAVPVDGGRHTIEATGPDRAPWSTQVTVAPEGETTSVDVPRLARVAPVVDATVPAADAAVTRKAAARPASRREPVRAVSVGFAATALALAAAGVALEISAERRYDRSMTEANDTRQRELFDSAALRRAGAVGLGAGAAVFGGLAIYLAVRGLPGHPVAIVTPNGLAIAGAF